MSYDPRTLLLTLNTAFLLRALLVAALIAGTYALFVPAIFAQAKSSATLAYTGENTYWVSFACVLKDSAWKCGCRDASCQSSFWNLQVAYNLPPPTVPGDGGGSSSDIPRIILDTDIGNDADDIGALAVAHALMDNGEIQLIGVANYFEYVKTVEAIDVVNSYYGRPNIPIGTRTNSTRSIGANYAVPVAALGGWDITTETAPLAKDFYRSLLAAQPDKSVTFVTVGPLGNIQSLLNSGPDQHSSLNGVELVRQKVKEFVIMGGGYPSRTNEWNFSGNRKGVTKDVVGKIPVPIVFTGFEIGVNVQTGLALQALEERNPIKVGYHAFNTNCPGWHKPCTGQIRDSASFDQTAILYAARGLSTYWNAVTGTCIPDDTGGNTWSNSGTNHRYLTFKASPQEIAKVISDLMVQKPKAR